MIRLTNRVINQKISIPRFQKILKIQKCIRRCLNLWFQKIKFNSWKEKENKRFWSCLCLRPQQPIYCGMQRVKMAISLRSPQGFTPFGGWTDVLINIKLSYDAPYYILLLLFMVPKSPSLNFNIQSAKQFMMQAVLEQKFDKLLKPNLLKDNFWIKIVYILQEKTNKVIKQSNLIYQGTRDGLNNQQYWNKVNGKGNLLMIFKSKSYYIFGAYSPCKWESCNGKYIEDNTLSSFIFSQTHDQVYPLKQDQKQNAIYCNSSSYGPVFGGGFDIIIDSNFTDGYCKLGSSYQFDQYKNGSEDPYLFGQNKPEITECEIYELQFV
ncbi:unnamed protein product [Paramecium pentaurelia]|uniref:TLDc domain-containing protein n=1 Tax=Paramecium pentaurelia TaxID=43138 RepID=A0A8S1V6A2_9CILI|nr:unnamed protein product [Paramecium pentaurelia]